MSDSLEEMKIRADYKHLSYPVSLRWRNAVRHRRVWAAGDSARFVFDSSRHLRYEGRVDNSYSTEAGKDSRSAGRDRRTPGASRAWR